MTDIVTRLRDRAYRVGTRLDRDAATLIDSLSARVRELEGVLGAARHAADEYCKYVCSDCPPGVTCAVDAIDDALATKEQGS